MMNRFLLKLQNRWQHVAHHASDHEYFEWVNPYVHWMGRPIGALLLTAIAALLCGLFVAPQGLVVFGSVMAVVAVGCVWPWVGIRGVSCSLSFSKTHTEEGMPVEAELTITNRWPWPVWGLAVEGGFDRASITEDIPAIAITSVGGWSRGRYRWTFTPEMRGQYPLQIPLLATEFPFGLWKASKQIQIDSSLIAWPRRFSLPSLPLPSGTQSWVGQPTESAAGSVGYRTTVREFRPGDSMRQIHWAKTALYDKLVSCEREGLAIADAKITLDTHPGLHPKAGSDSTLEWSIRIAASVAETLIRQGIGVSLVSHSGRFQADGSSNSLVRLLDWLALLQACDSDTSSVRAKARTNATITIHITTDLSGSAADDSIVLVTEDCADTAKEKPRLGWITLRNDTDIPQQVRRGWRNGPRRFSYA